MESQRREREGGEEEIAVMSRGDAKEGEENCRRQKGGAMEISSMRE